MVIYFLKPDELDDITRRVLSWKLCQEKQYRLNDDLVKLGPFVLYNLTRILARWILESGGAPHVYSHRFHEASDLNIELAYLDTRLLKVTVNPMLKAYSKMMRASASTAGLSLLIEIRIAILTKVTWCRRERSRVLVDARAGVIGIYCTKIYLISMKHLLVWTACTKLAKNVSSDLNSQMHNLDDKRLGSRVSRVCSRSIRISTWSAEWFFIDIWIRFSSLLWIEVMKGWRMILFWSSSTQSMMVAVLNASRDGQGISISDAFVNAMCTLFMFSQDEENLTKRK